MKNLSQTNCGIETYCQDYVKYKVLSLETIKHYEKVANFFCRENDVYYPSEVTEELLFQWRMIVIERASEATWNNYHRHLRALFNYLVEQDVLEVNPFNQVRGVKQYRRLPKTVPLDAIHQAIALLDQTEQFKPTWFWTIVLQFFYYHGIRRRQLVDLAWGDIDFMQNQFVLKISKTKCEQMKPLHPSIIDGLKRLEQETLQAKDSISPNDQVFNVTLFYHRYVGERMKVDQISGFFKRFGKHLQQKTGHAQRLSPHKLRHTMATLLSETGKIKALQELLGHSDPNTTNIYIHPTLQSLSDLIDVLPRIG